MPSRCVKCFRWKLLSYEDFFFTCSRWSAGGANGKQRNKTTTSGKKVIPLYCLKIWHEFYFRDLQSFLYFVGTIFSSLPVPIWYTPGWREAQHNDLSKSWTQTHQTGGHLAIHWTTTSPTKKRAWELDSLWSKTQLRVIIYHSYLFLLLPTSIGREWIIRSTKWRNKHGQVRLLY